MTTRLEEIGAAVHVTVNDATVAPRFDREALNEHDQLRRIVWITEGGTTERIKNQAGGRMPDDGSQFRIVASRWRIEDVDAHVYGESREAAELILDNLIAAVDLTVANVEMPYYRWVTQEQNNEGNVLAVQKCILRMRIRLPVPIEVMPLAPIPATLTDACGLLDANGELPPVPEPQT